MRPITIKPKDDDSERLTCILFRMNKWRDKGEKKYNYRSVVHICLRQGMETMERVLGLRRTNEPTTTPP
jgi:hypothetical protein